MAEAMTDCSAKHKLYGLKLRVSVNPRGFTVNCSQHERMSTPDITIFGNNAEIHASMRVKTETDRQIPDKGPIVVTYPDEWAVLADKGYQGLADHLCCIFPTKGSLLPVAVQRRDESISSNRVLVEKPFGLMCRLWCIVAGKYRWSKNRYGGIFQLPVSLTNAHIDNNPLRDVDEEDYAQRKKK